MADTDSRIPGTPRNPFSADSVYGYLYDVYTRETAPSDSDVVKMVYTDMNHITTLNALRVFKSKIRNSKFVEQKGKAPKRLALQPRSCSSEEMDRWVSAKRAARK